MTCDLIFHCPMFVDRNKYFAALSTINKFDDDHPASLNASNFIFLQKYIL